MSIIPALRGLKQEDHKFKVSLNYTPPPKENPNKIRIASFSTFLILKGT
jgi:hypothetical protein